LEVANKSPAKQRIPTLQTIRQVWITESSSQVLRVKMRKSSSKSHAKHNKEKIKTAKALGLKNEQIIVKVNF
jgi:hypothetical protein